MSEQFLNALDAFVQSVAIMGRAIAAQHPAMADEALEMARIAHDLREILPEEKTTP